MKAAPLSADMMVKLAVGVAAIGLVYFSYKKIAGAAGAAGDAIAAFGESAINEISTTLNPASPENIVNTSVNSTVGAIVNTVGDVTGVPNPQIAGTNADGSWNAGSYVYDMTHADPVTGLWWWQKGYLTRGEKLPMTAPQGHTAYWKN